MNAHIFGVIDGHGEHGHRVVRFLSQKLPGFVWQQAYLGLHMHTARWVLRAR
jgi:hypothetical protein